MFYYENQTIHTSVWAGCRVSGCETLWCVRIITTEDSNSCELHVKTYVLRHRERNSSPLEQFRNITIGDVCSYQWVLNCSWAEKQYPTT